MLRIYFTPRDLSLVRLAGDLDPLWNVALGARALQSRRPARGVRAWQRDARQRVTTAMRPLLELVPPEGGFPDFLTPNFVSSGVDQRITEMLETPTQQIRSEVAELLPEASGWLSRLCRGSVGARQELGDAVREFHRATLAPAQHDWEQRLSAERARWTRQLADSGLGSMLSVLMPRMAWEPPTLTYRDPKGRQITDVFLGGRGLTVYASPFTRDPLVVDLSGERPVLVVPSRAELTEDAARPGLGDLLGRTRANVLTALTQPASTTELARRLAISPASASEHAGVLRRSGLVATQRDAGSVLHTLTPLGSHLLARSGSRM